MTVPAAAGGARWTLRLLGGFELRDGSQRHGKLGTRAAMALLARLCLWPSTAHPRETLVELLWPGVAADAGRQRLRQTLSTLKQVLEPTGETGFAVIEADRLSLRLVPGSVWCDAVAFEAAYKRGDHDAAHALYAGELLPGFFDEWLADERLRLEGLFDRLRAPSAPAATAGPATAAARATAQQTTQQSAQQTTQQTTQQTAQQTAPAPGASLTAAGPQRAPLPAYLTRLIGADPQATHLRQQVAEHRLVTLMGPGGTGKTRMAVEVAQSLAAANRTGSTDNAHGAHSADSNFELVVFVPLAACRSRQDLLDQLLLSLQLAQGKSGALDSAVQALDGRHVLLVLDNFEQVVDDGAEAIGELGMRLPLLHQLVTSRRALAIAGEREVTVAALALPDSNATLAEAAANPAVSLFVDRSRAARAEFHLHDGNRAAVVELVQLLDGMPLAIELAAARVRSLAPAEMAATLRLARAGHADASALDLLARAPQRGRQDTRHRSMEDTIDWSWQLLTPQLRSLLAALTAFHGGFTAAAAQAVCTPTAGPVGHRLDDLMSHSLLRANPAEDGSDALRFSIYEPIREFAQRTLDADTAARLRHHLRAWSVAWGRAMPATPPLVALRAELPNFVAAMTSAVADQAPQDAIAIALALQPGFDHDTMPAAAQAALEAALQNTCAAPGSDSDSAACRARALVLLGLAWFRQGRGADAQRAVREALALATPAHASARARALVAAFTVAFNGGERGAGLLAWLDEATALATRVGDVQNIARAAAARSDLIGQTKDNLAECETLHRQALAIWQAQGNALSVLRARIGLGQLWILHSRYEAVQSEMVTVIDSAHQSQYWRIAAEALHLRGAALSRLRRHAQALSALGDSIALSWRVLDSYIALRAMWTLLAACARGQPAASQQLAGAMHTLWLQRFARFTPYQRAAMTGARRMASVQLGPAASAAAFNAGQRLTLVQAVSLAQQIAREGLGSPAG